MKKRLFLPIKNNKGMTLVEIILSIGLLGLMSAMAFMIFSASVMLAVRSGDNTVVTGNGSGILENALGGATITAGPGDVLQVLGVTIGEGQFTEDSSATATVRFSGVVTKNVPGSYVTVYTESELNTTTMAAFIPDPD